MKWIGQHIYDLASRFRNDVYLESISSGTIASGGNLGLDSNGKIVKAAVSSGGISHDGSTADGILTYKDADEATVEQYLTFANNSNISTLSLLSDQDTGDFCTIATTTHGATTLTTTDDDATAAHFEIAADGNITLDAAGDIALECGGADLTSDARNVTFSHGGGSSPTITLENNANDTTGARLVFLKDKGAAGADGDDLGTILFKGDNTAQEETSFASIVAEISEADDTDEAGKLSFYVAESDGSTSGLSRGLMLEGEHATDGQVDVTIANGTASTTTINGTLTMGSTAALTNAGLVAVANQSNITGVGTISSGVWNGTAIGGNYIAATQPNIDSIGTDGDTLNIIGNSLAMINTTTGKPDITLTNQTDDATGPVINLKNQRVDSTTQAGEDNDYLGKIFFQGYNDAGTPALKYYASITSQIHDATDGEESGKLTFGIANHDGGVGSGLILTGGSENNEIDVTVGLGANSVVTIPGNIDLAGDIDVDGTLEADAITVAGTALTSVCSPVAGHASIATVGTIGTGVWQGTAVASAYLDSDTSHLSVAQTFTAAKTFGTTNKLQFRDANAYINSPDSNDIEIAATDITLDAGGTIKLEGPVRPTGQIQAVYSSFSANDLGTKHYLGFNDGDSENTDQSHVDMPLVCPVAGKLLSVSVRQTRNQSSDTYTIRLETQATGVTHATGPTIVGTQSGSAPTNTSIVTYDFQSSLDSGDNIIDAGDYVYISIESDSNPSGTTKYFFTCLFEWDYSSIT